MSNHVHSCRILSILVKSCLFLLNPVNSIPCGATPCPWAIINATNGIFIDFISKDRFLAAKRSQRQLQEPFFALLLLLPLLFHTETAAEGMADFEV